MHKEKDGLNSNHCGNKIFADWKLKKCHQKAFQKLPKLWQTAKSGHTGNMPPTGINVLLCSQAF